MSEDKLLKAIKLLTEAVDSFDMIVWCPEQHVLSFRRAGAWQWVNIWLHGESDGDHVCDVNGGYGWGGSDPRVLWVAGEQRDGNFIVNMPKRRMDGTQNPIADLPAIMAERCEHIDPLPPVPGAVTGGSPS